jgi:hypothetical protein
LSAQKTATIDIRRTFTQPDDAISAYGDYTQVSATAEEVVFQFYETIPGIPGEDAHIRGANSRLRATVMMSRDAAGRLVQVVVDALAAGKPPIK